jgi:hypothetical protein
MKRHLLLAYHCEQEDAENFQFASCAVKSAFGDIRKYHQYYILVHVSIRYTVIFLPIIIIITIIITRV